MKKLFLLTLFFLVCFTIGGQYAGAGVQYGPHDFTITGKQQFLGDNNEVCIYCHTPHGGVVRDAAGTKLPLWNRSLNEDGPAFTMYNSDSFDAKNQPGYANKPLGFSLLCLSCHDGVSSLGDVINNSVSGSISMNRDTIGSITNYPSYRNINIGNDISNDHPVSFAYGDLHLVDTELQDPTAIDSRLKLYGASLLIECTTCHDPHEYGNTAPTKMPFLRMSNAGSAMCVECHYTK